MVAPRSRCRSEADHGWSPILNPMEQQFRLRHQAKTVLLWLMVAASSLALLLAGRQLIDDVRGATVDLPAAMADRGRRPAGARRRPTHPAPVAPASDPLSVRSAADHDAPAAGRRHGDAAAVWALRTVGGGLDDEVAQDGA